MWHIPNPIFAFILNMRYLKQEKDKYKRKTTGEPVAGILSIKAPVNGVNFLLL